MATESRNTGLGRLRTAAAFSLCASFMVFEPLNANTITVLIGTRTLTPQNLAIHVGDTVVWSKGGSAGMTTESYGGEWASPLLTNRGDTYSYTFNSPGDFTYRSLAFSDSLVEYNAAGRIVVLPWTNSPPAITLNSPIQGLSFSPALNILFLASVTNSPNEVDRVEFYSGTDLLATATNAPYQQRVFDFSPGQHEVTAKVFYLSGAVATSAPVQINVDPGGTSKITEVVRLPTGQIRLYYEAPETQHWLLFSSDDLTNWTYRRFVVTPGPWVDDTAVDVPRRFYRLRFEPGFAP